MEREEAEHVTQAEEERARQEVKDQQKFVTKGAQAISEA